MQTESQTAYGTTAPAAGALGAGSSPATQRSTLDATAPGQLRTIKRNGTVVSYDESKIAVAITKAFLAVEGGNAAASSRIRELVADLASQVTGTFKRRMPSGGTVHIEDIQDQVELALMRSGEQRAWPAPTCSIVNPAPRPGKQNAPSTP